MEDFVRSWSYLGVAIGILATGIPLMPMPEELPVVIGGALAGGSPNVQWWIMLPVCIASVVVGDMMLYFIGRRWGRKLLHIHFVQRFLPPARIEKFAKGFHDNGIRILLLARLTPGIRMPIFFTAGLTRLPFSRFAIADGIYALPLVNLLFWLGYWFGDRMADFIKQEAKEYQYFIMIGVVVVVGGYIYWKLRRKVVPVEVATDPPAGSVSSSIAGPQTTSLTTTSPSLNGPPTIPNAEKSSTSPGDHPS